MMNDAAREVCIRAIDEALQQHVVLTKGGRRYAAVAAFFAVEGAVDELGYKIVLKSPHLAAMAWYALGDEGPCSVCGVLLEVGDRISRELGAVVHAACR